MATRADALEHAKVHAARYLESLAETRDVTVAAPQRNSSEEIAAVMDSVSRERHFVEALAQWILTHQGD